MASRKKRLEALETLYGKRESTIDDEPMILRSPEEYWREYRTYFHIGQAYGISESAAYRLQVAWSCNVALYRLLIRSCDYV